MVNGTRASDPCGLHKGHGSKFCVGSRVQLVTPEEGLWTYRLKHCEYKIKDEDNSPKTLHDDKNNNDNLHLHLVILFQVFLLHTNYL